MFAEKRGGSIALWAKKTAFWVACAVIPIALLCLLCAWGDVYPFGSQSFLTEDLKYQYVDFFSWYYQVLTGQTSLFYSFGQGLGSNTWGLYSYYLASPFNLLLALFGPDRITEFAFCVSAIKLACIQVAMAWYLRRRFSLGYGWAFLLALSFAFSAWTVSNIRNIMWLDSLILLPLAAYACYCLVRDGRFLPLAVVVAIDVLTCWYMAYMTIVFLCLFVVFELLLYRFEGAVFDRRFVLGCAVRFAGAIILGVALSAWIFLPSIFALGGETSRELDWLGRHGIVPFVCGFLPGMWVDNYVPQFYTSCVAMVLAVALFFVRRVDRRIRITCFVLAAFFAAGSMFYCIEYVWCGMRAPSGFYSRSAFAFAFFTVWLAGYCVHVLVCGAKADGPEKPRLPLCIVSKRAFAVVAVLVVCCDVVLNAHSMFQQLYADYSQEEYSGYVEEATTQYAELEEYDVSAFYRVDKTYTRVQLAALNEGLAYDVAELSSYSSTSNPQAIAFLNAMGYSTQGEMFTRFASSNLVMDTVLGVKYVSTVGVPVAYEDVGLSEVSNGASFYRNPYALSLGIAASGGVVGSALPSGDNPFERQNAMASAISGEDIQLFSRLDAECSVSDEGVSTWRVEVPAGAIGYLFVVKGDTAVSLSIDGGEPIAEGWRFENNVRALGEAGSVATEHTISTSNLPEGADCVFYALDVEVFEQWIGELSSNQFEPSTFENGFIEGDYWASDETTLLLSVPYDAGWSVIVNGIECDMESVFDGGMSAIEVSEGGNHIELRYRSPGLIAGCVLSAVALGVFVALVVASRRHRDREA